VRQSWRRSRGERRGPPRTARRKSRDTRTCRSSQS
jgi:hypothetical protein